MAVTAAGSGSPLPAAASALAAASSTVTIASGSPVLVAAGIKKGDVVGIQATLFTDDPNENGEGEPLILQSTGGFSLTISAYAQPRTVSYLSHNDNESISGYISGYDGDEYATVTVTVNSTAKKRFSQKTKDALNRAQGTSTSWRRPRRPPQLALASPAWFCRHPSTPA
jgi:hypothetical protein